MPPLLSGDARPIRGKPGHLAPTYDTCSIRSNPSSESSGPAATLDCNFSRHLEKSDEPSGRSSSFRTSNIEATAACHPRQTLHAALSLCSACRLGAAKTIGHCTRRPPTIIQNPDEQPLMNLVAWGDRGTNDRDSDDRCHLNDSDDERRRASDRAAAERAVAQRLILEYTNIERVRCGVEAAAGRRQLRPWSHAEWNRAARLGREQFRRDRLLFGAAPAAGRRPHRAARDVSDPALFPQPVAPDGDRTKSRGPGRGAAVVLRRRLAGGAASRVCHQTPPERIGRTRVRTSRTVQCTHGGAAAPARSQRITSVPRQPVE